MCTRQNEYGQATGALLPNYTRRELPPKSPLIGKYVQLEALCPEKHLDDLWYAYGLAQDGRDWTYLLNDNFPEDIGALRQLLNTKSSLSEMVTFAIISKSTGKAIGMMSYMRIDTANGTIEMGGINMSVLLKQTREGAEAIYLMAARAFDELGYRRLEWRCDSLHVGSRSAAVRYGFTFEGVFRNAVVYKGRTRDTAWYSIIDAEWPRVKVGFEKWLQESNFRSNGQQIRRLAECREETIIE